MAPTAERALWTACLCAGIRFLYVARASGVIKEVEGNRSEPVLVEPAEEAEGRERTPGATVQTVLRKAGTGGEGEEERENLSWALPK
eukprot:10837393-Karenia_brevis.AAC.1